MPRPNPQRPIAAKAIASALVPLAAQLINGNAADKKALESCNNAVSSFTVNDYSELTRREVSNAAAEIRRDVHYGASFSHALNLFAASLDSWAKDSAFDRAELQAAAIAGALKPLAKPRKAKTA